LRTRISPQGGIARDQAGRGCSLCDRAHGAIPWPAWLSASPVPFGCSVLVLRLALQLVGNVVSLASNRDLYPLPPITGVGEAKTFE